MKKKKQKYRNTNHTRFLHQSIYGSRQARQYPKSETYRNELEPYVDKNVDMKGTIMGIKKEHVGHRYVNRLLLTDVTCITENSEIPIDHLWITIEKGFIHRNGLACKHVIKCKGCLYEYANIRKKDEEPTTRNIGFRVYEINILAKLK